MIRWEDPPEKATGRYRGRPSKWPAVAEELKERPGRWALVAISTKWTTVRSADISLRRLGCEVTCRGNPQKGGKVYARWPAKITKVAAARKSAARKPRRKK